MNIPQTSYQLYFNPAILGMQAIAGEVCRKISRIAKGIIYYGRAVIQSRLFDNVCRLPRQNKATLAITGTMTAGSLQSVIVHGAIQNGEVAASTVTTTVTTAFTSTLADTLTQHALDVTAALADTVSCIATSDTALEFIGDCEDIVSFVTTEVAGYNEDTFAAATTVSTNDTVNDIIGISYLTHDRQQQVATNSGLTYYQDTEPVNIMQAGTVFVYAEEAVSPAADPFARLITNGVKYAGYLGQSEDSSKCVDVEASKFLQTTVAPGLVPFIGNFPQ